MSQPNAFTRKRSKILLSVVSVLVLVIAAELACRLLTAAFWPESTPGALGKSMEALLAKGRGAEDDPARKAQESIHPYFGFIATPGISMTEKSYPVTESRLLDQVGPGPAPWWYTLETNNWGFWSKHEMPYRKREGEFVVVVLGGSVAQWFALQGEAVFAEELKDRVPGLERKEVVVLNFAMSSHKQPQQVMVLAYLLNAGVEPDAVVHIDGFNEAALSFYNVRAGFSPEYPRSDFWAFALSGLGYSNRVLSLMAEQFQENEETSRLAAAAIRSAKLSNLLGLWYARRAAASASRAQLLHARLQHAVNEDVPAYREFAVKGPSAGLPEDRSIEAITRIWLEGTRSLASLCRGRDIAYLHVLQPTLHDTVPQPSKERLTAGEIEIAAYRGDEWGVWAEAVKKIYPSLRAGAGAIREEGIAFEDMSYLFRSTSGPIYYDICHYNQRGNDLLAEAIAGRLAAELE